MGIMQRSFMPRACHEPSSIRTRPAYACSRLASTREHRRWCCRLRTYLFVPRHSLRHVCCDERDVMNTARHDGTAGTGLGQQRRAALKWRRPAAQKTTRARESERASEVACAAWGQTLCGRHRAQANTLWRTVPCSRVPCTNVWSRRHSTSAGADRAIGEGEEGFDRLGNYRYRYRTYHPLEYAWYAGWYVGRSWAT